MKIKYVVFFLLSSFFFTGFSSATQHVTDIKFVFGGQNTLSQEVTYGQVFGKGHIQRREQIVATTSNSLRLPTQADVKTRYSDGSIRHAVLTHVLPGVDDSSSSLVVNLGKEQSVPITRMPVSLDGLLASNYDVSVTLTSYSVDHKKVTFGDRVTPWNVGDVVTINLGGVDYSYTVDKAGSNYTLGEKIAAAFVSKISADATEVVASYRYESLSLIAKKGGNVDISVSNSGNAPITIERLTQASTPVKYQVSAKAALLESKQRGELVEWLSGPIVSEWVASANLTDLVSGDTHPHLAIRFNVRANRDFSSVKTDVIVENSWSYVEGHQNQFYDVSVAVGGEEVYAKEQLEHYSHSRWKKTFWSGRQTDAIPQHNIEYLLSTKQLPNYDRSFQISASSIQTTVDGWTGEKTEPMHIGDATPYMPGTGAHHDIGPLPRWQAMYLLSMDPGMRKVTLDSADLAGTWSIHYRDKNTGLPITLDDYPYMTIAGNPADTYNPNTKKYERFPKCGGYCSSIYHHDVAHQPSFAYLPYLLTGEHYYLEELQFWAGYNALQSNPGYRSAGLGLPEGGQIRELAWTLRTLTRAAAITPDDHPLKHYFETQLRNSLNYYNDRYTNNPEVNQLGFLTHGYALAYSGGRGIAPWMDDFFTWAVGHAIELGYKEAEHLMQWKARFPIGRMIAPGYCWVHAAPYSLNVRDSSHSDFYGSFKEIYQNLVSVEVNRSECGSEQMANLLGLKTGEMKGYAGEPAGYPANMQPALALAADFFQASGRDAWSVFDSRSIKPDYSVYPNWAIVPRESDSNGEIAKPARPNRIDQSLSISVKSRFARVDEQITFELNEALVRNDHSYRCSVPSRPMNSVASPNAAEEGKKCVLVPDKPGKYTVSVDDLTSGKSYTYSVVAASSVLVDSLQKLNDNQAVDLGKYNCEHKAPVGERGSACVTISDYSGMIEDRLNGNMLMFGGGHAATARTDIDVFDFNTLRWDSAYESTPCSEMNESNFDKNEAKWISTGHPASRHTYDLLGSTAYPHEFLIFRGGGAANGAISCVGFNQYTPNRVAHYSFETGEWSFGDVGKWSNLAASEFDPVSGWFVFVDSNGIYGYDPKVREAFKINAFSRAELGYANNLVYYPPLDAFYYFTSGGSVRVFEIKLDRVDRAKTAIRLVDHISGSVPNSGETAWDYDSVNKVIGGGIKNGEFFVFNPVARRWDSKTIEAVDSDRSIGSVAFHSMAYSSNYNAYVFKTDYPSGHRIWLYRYKSRATGGEAKNDNSSSGSVPINLAPGTKRVASRLLPMETDEVLLLDRAERYSSDLSNLSYSGVVSGNKPPKSVFSGVRETSTLPIDHYNYLPDNTVVNLGKYDCEERLSFGERPCFCNNISDYSAFVPVPGSNQVLLFGGHSTARNDIDSFNLDSEKWASLYFPTQCEEMVESNLDREVGRWLSTGHPVPRAGYDLMGYANATNELVLLRSGLVQLSGCSKVKGWVNARIAHYGLSEGGWRFTSVGMWGRYDASEYDPVSDRFIIVGQKGVYTYDPVSGVQQHVVSANWAEIGYSNNLVYYPPEDLFYLITRGSPVAVYKLELDRGAWQNSNIVKLDNLIGELPALGQTGWAYDSHNKIIGGGITNGVFHYYDPEALKWGQSKMVGVNGAEINVSQSFHSISFSQAHNYFLFKTGSNSGHKMLKYRFKN